MQKYFLVVLILVFTSCKKKEAGIFPVQEKISSSVYASGVVKSKNQYQVYSTVSGILSGIFISKGDKVKKGDALFKVKNTTAQLNTANASITADYATVTANAEKLKELQNNINLAKATMDHEASLLERQQNLWSQQIGTRNEVEQRMLSLKTAVTNYETAKGRYSSLEKQLQLQASQANNNLKISKSIGNDYTIKSETNGTVYAILKEKGELVQPSNPIALVGNDTTFILELQVDEYDIAKIKTNQIIAIQMDSYKEQIFEAVVESIDPLMNEKTKSFTVHAAFSKRPSVLYPNLTCEANILIETKEKAITIPRNYLIDGDFVLLENKVKRKVTTGLKDFKKVEITGGLTIKDKIFDPSK